MRLTLRLILIVPILLGTAVLGNADTTPGDSQNPAATAPAQPASATLAALDATARSNAVLTLEALGGTIPAWPLPSAAEVESIWNRGNHDEALLALQQLETAGATFAPTINWREPVTSHQKFYYQDVRIGDPRTGATDMVLDFHSGEDTIFAAVSWLDSWTMNISTDGGVTWQETFYYGTESRISMTVAGDHVWVSYVLSSAPTEVRMRRFDAATGAVDGVYFWELVANVSPANVDDVALINNAPDFDTAVYVAVIDSNDNVRTYWDDLVGTSFDEYSPPVTNAESHLDFAYCPYGFSSSGYVAYLSFESNTGQLEVWRMSWLGTWDQVQAVTLYGSHHYTAVSAFKETVMTAYENDFANGNGINYRVSYDHGVSWFGGTIYAPDVSGPAAFGADVSLDSGMGVVVTYNREEGAVDPVYHRNRRGLGSGVWDEPFEFSNFDSMSAMKTEVNFIGAGCVSSYGMLYLGDTGIPYFDLVTPRGFFCDGFESGNTAAWD